MKRWNLQETVVRWALPGLIVMLSGCGRGTDNAAPSPVPDNALMMVGDRVLTLDAAEAMARERGAGVGRELLLEERQRHLQWVALARQTGFDRRPEVVEAMEQLIVDRMARSEMESAAADYPEDELKRRYEVEPARFVIPERRRVAVIQIRVPSRAEEVQRERAHQRAKEALQALVQSTAQTVGDCVARYSDDNATRLRCGDAGWVTLDPKSTPWPPSLHQAVLKLAGEGDCTGILEGPDGLLVARLLELVPASRRPFAEVKDELRWTLQREAEQRHQARVLQRLDAAVPVRIHDSNRIRFLTPSARPQPKDPAPLPSR